MLVMQRCNILFKQLRKRSWCCIKPSFSSNFQDSLDATIMWKRLKTYIAGYLFSRIFPCARNNRCSHETRIWQQLHEILACWKACSKALKAPNFHRRRKIMSCNCMLFSSCCCMNEYLSTCVFQESYVFRMFFWIVFWFNTNMFLRFHQK